MPTALAHLLMTTLAVTPAVLVPTPQEVSAAASLQVASPATSTGPSSGLVTGRATGRATATGNVTAPGSDAGPIGRPGSRLVATPESGVWPLAPDPGVVRGFDPPVSAYGAGHRGVDLLGSPGQAVLAAVSGRITYAGSLAGRGVVVIDHGPTRTTYQPVDAEVAVGSLVQAGQRVGSLQTSGSHCAPAACLHWGLVGGSMYLDPLSLVGARQVRLLPLTGLDPRWSAPP